MNAQHQNDRLRKIHYGEIYIDQEPDYEIPVPYNPRRGEIENGVIKKINRRNTIGGDRRRRVL